MFHVCNSTFGRIRTGVFTTTLALSLACGSGSSPEGTLVSAGASGAGASGAGASGAGASGAGASGAGASGAGASGAGGQIDLITDDDIGSSSCRTVDSCVAGECGPVADGCGDVIDCGGCTAPETCGGGGMPSRCGGGGGDCTPTTCEEIGAECGSHADGCGGVLDCASCEDAAEECVEGACIATATCDPLTCADYAPAEGRCGLVSDGCGSTLDCGFSCSSDEVCGATELGFCGSPECTPLSCETALSDEPDGFCGLVPDGCGGVLTGCETTCVAPETCGGAGVTDQCGQSDTPCEPLSASACDGRCGPISDGCGGTLSCAGCEAPETCGGGDEPGVCGAPTCQPNSCQDLQFECGSAPDGCGGTTGDCGTCADGAICNANRCEQPVCEPRTAQEACEGLCGSQSDGCGGVVDCGGCAAPNTCGGGGTPSVCGAPACTPLTCEDVGANCGAIGDGCGGVVASCGTCEAPEICGGGGTPSVCGFTASEECTGLCPSQAVCEAGSETRLTGVVYAPNGTQPLYNALVYVPNAALPSLPQGVGCERCEDEDLGEPLVAALTGADGSFVLTDVPADVSFPLVVKMGKWRRVVTIDPVAPCTSRALGVDDARLPRHMSDASAGNVQYLSIPQMAMVTGDVDELECVLRKIGVDDSEFTLPSGGGRVHLYRANGASQGCTNYRSNGECRSDGRIFADDSELFQDSRLDDYDVAIFGCEGSENEHGSTQDQALYDWANRGGRVFASHYSYTYLDGNEDFDDVANWGGNWNDNGSTTTGIIDTSHAKGQAFDEWLGHTAAHHSTYGAGYISIDDPRSYVQSLNSGTERFVHTDASAVVDGDDINVETAVQQFSFNTPVGAGANDICGRVLYSAFHVAGASDNDDEVFPSHCSNGPLTPQEKVLQFMLFDLSSCVSIGAPPVPVSCEPRSCAEVGANCGSVADGCGGVIDCGACTAPDICGGGGPNQCGSGCTLTTCGAQGANCGSIADGCGGTLDCGSCVSPAICGGGGTANVCGTPACTPRSCASVGATCGSVSDGCGGTVECGDCASPAVCGGGGTPNQCGEGSCLPQGCADVGATCGYIGDGCGGTVACGDCESGSECGAAGPNQCGQVCAPRTCGDAGAECGFIGDGCGGTLDCGDCSGGATCGGGGVPSVCGGFCEPRTCSDAGANCGSISDGCGGVVDCGACPAGEVCGAAGPNQCGAGGCTPRSCEDAGAECGGIGDGCSGALDCGPCVAPESCGGGGTPNQCGLGGCVPLTCAGQGANCGPVADGCGGLLDCGSCANGDTCGGGGTPSQCGGGIQ